MKRAISALAVVFAFLAASAAMAQESYWIQVELNGTLRTGEQSARRYSQTIDKVTGFRLANRGGYAIAIGPFTEDRANSKLFELRARGAVPRDAYIADSTIYGEQYWPVGVNALVQAPVATAVNAAPETAEPVTEATPMPVALPEETLKEARASERQLDGEQRRALQVALQWEGFYNSGIDGAFGPGTRAGMRRWQEAKGYETTGVLTSRQRAELLQGYNDMLASMGLTQTTDPDAGITVQMPTAMVAFERYEAPFAHYEGDDGVRVILISQRGDRATLYGLYDVLQTLKVVPPEGDRNRRDRDFTIEGVDDKLYSYTYAKLIDGAVKGYMLLWPREPEAFDVVTGEMTRDIDRRRALVLDAMRTSFASAGAAALNDNAGLDSATQSIDLISGLEIRRAEKSRSGFFVTGKGHVITTTEAVEGCKRITLDESYDATVRATDDTLGLALLAPAQALSPLAVADFLSFEPRLNSEVAVAGYSYGGRLSSPTLTFGTLADVRGLAGEETIARLEIRAQDGDTGGPVIDPGGAVLGLLQAALSDGGRLLPADVGFFAKGSAVSAFLAAQGLAPSTTDIQGALTPYDLSGLAADMTVLVSCWK